MAAIIRDETLEKSPQLEDIFGPVSEVLTDDVLIELNGQVDVDGREPGDVAFEWLVREGFLSEEG